MIPILGDRWRGIGEIDPTSLCHLVVKFDQHRYMLGLLLCLKHLHITVVIQTEQEFFLSPLGEYLLVPCIHQLINPLSLFFIKYLCPVNGSQPKLHSENLAPLPEPRIELMTAKMPRFVGLSVLPLAPLRLATTKISICPLF